MENSNVINGIDKNGYLFTYRTKQQGILITGAKGKSGRLIIPDFIMDQPVTGIGKKAFMGLREIKEIILPEKLKEVEDWAFAGCLSLKTVWLPKKKITFGKGVFKGCIRLQEMCFLKEEGKYLDEQEQTLIQTARLLAAVPVKLKADYLLNMVEAGTSPWLATYDARLITLLQKPDSEGYSKMVYCGEEDIMASMELYLESRKRDKAALCYLRLLNPVGLSISFEKELKEYLKGHTKGCESEAAWKLLTDEHGTEHEYYRVFAEAGGIREDNIHELLSDLKDQFPEMKAYLIRYREENMQKRDFFESLSLDF